VALNGLFCADVPLRNYSLTHYLYSAYWNIIGRRQHARRAVLSVYGKQHVVFSVENH